MKVLKHHPDILPHFIDISFSVVNGGAVYCEHSLIDRLKSVDASEQCAFTGTGW